MRGLGNNIDFLSAIMQHPRFRDGHLTTGFIAEEYPKASPAPRRTRRWRASSRWPAFSSRCLRAERDARIDGQLGPAIRLNAARVAVLGDHRFEVVVSGDGGERRVSIDGSEPEPAALDWRFGEAMARLRFAGEDLSLRIRPP